MIFGKTGVFYEDNAIRIGRDRDGPVLFIRIIYFKIEETQEYSITNLDLHKQFNEINYKKTSIRELIDIFSEILKDYPIYKIEGQDDRSRWLITFLHKDKIIDL